MDYDVVVVTRNRLRMLEFSIPSFVGQSHPPRRLIVVDASDDHEAVAKTVRRACDGTRTEAVVLSFRPWMTAQRNEGLRHVKAPIVMIPDDDSVWLDGAAEGVLRVYERDREGVVGGVAMAETRTPPAVLTTDAARAARQATLAERLIYRFANLKVRLMRRLAAPPLRVAGTAMLERIPKPDWLEEVRATPVPVLIGFRMSFRTEAIRRHGFNEGLARGRGLDDFDASLALLRDGWLLLETEAAHVYHHRAGGKRGRGVELGVTQVLNMAYITCRHTEPGHPARDAIRPYVRLMVLDYALRAYSRFGRERLTGIRRASRCLDELLDAPPDRLTAQYQQAFERCVGGPAGP